FSSSIFKTSSRFLSTLARALTDVSEPGAVSCCVASGSLSQRRVYLGTSFLQRTWVRPLVVQVSAKVLGCVVFVEKDLASLALTMGWSQERGMVWPLKRTGEFEAAVLVRLLVGARSCINATGLVPAMTVEIPAWWSISATVGTSIYLPPVRRSPRRMASR